MSTPKLLCDTCPEGQGTLIPMPTTAGPSVAPPVAYIVYTGGPYSYLYRMVEAAIPPDADLKHGRPKFADDGSFEYPPGDAEVEDLQGYRRNAENPRRFHPAWPDCLCRQLSVSVSNRMLVIAGKCFQPTAGRLNRTTTLDECQKCPYRYASRPIAPPGAAETAIKATGKTDEPVSPPCSAQERTA
jgi:hypothetical protein